MEWRIMENLVSLWQPSLLCTSLSDTISGHFIGEYNLGLESLPFIQCSTQIKMRKYKYIY